jgi:hypothetical protein
MGTKWKPHEIELLKEHYSDKTIKQLCEIINRSQKSIYSQANLLGLKKSYEHMQMLKKNDAENIQKLGFNFRFKKNDTPWNLGAKGYMGGNATSFKKGNKPHNTKQVGDTIINKDGFLLVKIADKKWIRKEILIWEEVNGKIPKGHVVRVINPALNKYDINNLMLISFAENMKLNTMHRFPTELKNTIKALSKLKKTIRKHGTQ